MSLIKCPDCQKDVSESSGECVNCGCPIPSSGKQFDQSIGRFKQSLNSEKYPYLSILICPVFPIHPLVEIETLPKIIAGIDLRDPRGRFIRNGYKRIPDGILYVDEKEHKGHVYGEINNFGLIHFSESCSVVQGQKINPHKTIFRNLWIAMLFSKYFYEKANFKEDLDMKFSLHNIEGKSIVISNGNDDDYDQSRENQNECSLKIKADTSEPNLNDHCKKAISKLLWVFGVDEKTIADLELGKYLK